MNKQSYLDTLSNALSHLSDHERSEIVSDYDSHFESAYEDGLDDESIIKGLGDPEVLAQKYLVEPIQTKEEDVFDIGAEEVEAVSDVEEQPTMQEVAVPVSNKEQTHSKNQSNTYEAPKNQQNTQVRSKGRSPLGSVLIAFLLIFFNLTFVLGPFIGVWGVWFGGFVAGIAFVVEGIKMIVLASTVNSYSVGLSEITLIAQIGFYLTTGGFLTLLMIKAAKGLGLLTKKYALWNAKVVKGEA